MIVSGNAWVDPELKDAIESVHKIKVRDLNPFEKKMFDHIKYEGQQKLRFSDEMPQSQATVDEYKLPEAIILYMNEK